MIYIYFLEENGVPFYIGKTKNPKKRRYIHRYKKKRDIQLSILDEVEEENWKFWESYWIWQFKSWGFKLENKNNGGGGPKEHSEETKKKIKNILNSKSEEEKKIINEKRRVGNLGKSRKGGGRKLFTKEEKLKLGQRSYYKSLSFIKKKQKKVIQIDPLTNKIINEFNSVSEAANFIGIKQPILSGSLTGKYRSKGYIWQYKN